MAKKKIHEKMIELLSDMQVHPVKDVHALLMDSESRQDNIHPHLVEARKKLAPDKTIICQTIGMVRYYRTIWLTDPALKDEPLEV